MIYDARLEIEGWCEPGFDDSEWANCVIAEMPRGKAKICECEPIVVSKELKPVSVTKHMDGYLYDFGVNYAGVTRIRIKGERGQTITVDHATGYTEACSARRITTGSTPKAIHKRPSIPKGRRRGSLCSFVHILRPDTPM